MIVTQLLVALTLQTTPQTFVQSFYGFRPVREQSGSLRALRHGDAGRERPAPSSSGVRRLRRKEEHNAGRHRGARTKGRGWSFVNFRYTEIKTDLLTLLAQYAADRKKKP
jgi:hypothetical protein